MYIIIVRDDLTLLCFNKQVRDGWAAVRSIRRTDGRTSGQRTDGRKEGWTKGQKDARTHRRANGRTEERTDGRTDKQTACGQMDL